MTDQQEIDTFSKSVREADKRGWWHNYRDVLPDWFATYLILAQAALQIRAYEAQFVPGLFQTADYARALLGAGNPHVSSEATERRVALWLRRQELLARAAPPRVWIVMRASASSST